MKTRDMTQVSVIIPAHNAAATIARQLEALRRQEGAPTFEVIVVDNRSTEPLEPVVAPFTQSLDLRVVHAPEHQGVAYARNVGIAHARADHLMFCDADDVAGPRWVQYGHRTLTDFPLWSGSVTMVTDAELDLPLDQVWALLPEAEQWQPPVSEQRGAPIPVLLGGHFGATRDALERIGGFDQSFPLRAEDNDFAIRARQAGFDIPVSKVTTLAAGRHENETRQIAVADARAHAQLLARHDLWQASPFHSWPEEVLRVLLATLRAALMQGYRDPDELGLRWARTLGYTCGSLRYRNSSTPTPLIGLGWKRRETTSHPPTRDSAPVQASVIIPAHNAEPWIAEQLDSLAAQVDAPDFEVVIGDNGSTDRTVEVATSGRWDFPVRVIDASGPQSAAHARNVAAAAAHTDHLLFCDADDFVSPHWVRALTEALAQPGVAVQGAVHAERFNDADVLAAYNIDPDPEPDPDAAVTPAGGFAGYLPTLPGGSFAVRRADYVAVGGMDPSFPGGSEETDFSWRVQTERGLRIVSAPQAFIHYRLKHTARSLFRQQRIQQRARMLLWVRYRDTPMRGPSWKASLGSVARSLVTAPRHVTKRRPRLAWAYQAGAHVGALEGMVSYRLLGRIPAPQRWNGEIHE